MLNFLCEFMENIHYKLNEIIMLIHFFIKSSYITFIIFQSQKKAEIDTNLRLELGGSPAGGEPFKL